MDTGHRTESTSLRNEGRSRLSEIIQHLPVAIGLFDQTGHFVIRSGALRSMLSEMVPSRDSKECAHWQIFDERGLPSDPSGWPASRALRGETVMPGMRSVYNAVGVQPRRLRVSAIPFSDGSGFVGAVGLAQDLDLSKRAQAGLCDNLEVRFVGALFDALSTVCDDGNYLDPSAARSFIAWRLGFPDDRNSDPPDGLTLREAQVLNLLAWGKSHKEIGTELGISVKTVQFHRAAAAARLRLRSRTDIVRYALSQNWLSAERAPR